MPKGQCHCGAIRYEMPADVEHHALCHCQDCRRASGGVAVSWGLAAREAVTIDGEPRVYASSEHGRRHFCAKCGTSLFYTNEAIFPGKIDVQTATLDNPDAIPLGAQIQVAERIGWLAHVGDLPAFQRYPGMD